MNARLRLAVSLLVLFSLACNLPAGEGQAETPTSASIPPPISTSPGATRTIPTSLPATLTPGAPMPTNYPGAVYYVSPSGKDDNPGTLEQPWQTIQKAADSLQAGETALIRQGTYAEQVMVHVSGAPGAPVMLAAYPGEQATIDGSGVQVGEYGGLVEIIGVSHITFSGLRVTNSPAAGILAEDCSHILIEKNYTYNTVSSGIGAWHCTDVIIEGNEVELANNDGEQENISIGGTDGFEVRYNHVHHGGPGTNGGEGICPKDGSSNGKVYGNRVHDLNRLGIYVDAWDKHTFNIEVYQNIVYDNAADGITLSSEQGGLLENIRVYNNLVYRNQFVGINFMLCCEGAETHPEHDILIANNTIYGNGTGEWGGGILVENPFVENVRIRNNLVSQNLSFQIAIDPRVPAEQVSVAYNLIDGFREGEGETRGENFVEGDPLFVDAAGFDFHLLPGSPAIDQGFPDEAPGQDYDGSPRPVDGDGDGTAEWDIGAFEWKPAGMVYFPLVVFKRS